MRLSREAEEQGMILTMLGCSCHVRAYQLVEKGSVQFHTCCSCKAKINLENPTASMLSCSLLTKAESEVTYDDKVRKSICSSCLWPQLLGPNMRRPAESISEEVKKSTAKTRNK
jgi:hypothetical protein